MNSIITNFSIAIGLILFVGTICGFIWTTRTARRIKSEHKSIAEECGKGYLVLFYILLLIISPFIMFAISVESITKTK